MCSGRGDRSATVSCSPRATPSPSTGVAVLADIHFGTRVEGEGEHVRFSYASSFEAIDEGLNRIADFIRKNRR